MTCNQAIVLQARPTGLPQSSNFALVDLPIVTPSPDQILVQTLMLSIDPAMRGWMDDKPNYLPPVALGAPMRSLGLARVLESRDRRFPPGSIVRGALGWQSHPTLPIAGLEVIDEGLGDLEAHLGVYGLPGLTAYFGLTDVARVRPGETVLITAAAGAVGLVAGQMAKALGCTVVGVASGAAKCEFLRSIGYDAVIDRSAVRDPALAIAEVADEAGFDVYFDNVGGAWLDAALLNLANGARVVACGRISQSSVVNPRGVVNIGQLIVRRARMEGFVTSDYVQHYDQARQHIAALVRSGQIKYRTHVVNGLSRAPEALNLLLEGRTFGKVVVDLCE